MIKVNAHIRCSLILQRYHPCPCLTTATKQSPQVTMQAFDSGLWIKGYVRKISPATDPCGVKASAVSCGVRMDDTSSALAEMEWSKSLHDERREYSVERLSITKLHQAPRSCCSQTLGAVGTTWVSWHSESTSCIYFGDTVAW